MQATENSSSDSAIKVFYDGQCPMCRREIEHYQGLKGADRIDWVDITLSSEVLEQHDLTLDQAMARFHVLDGQGQWQVGAYGFVEMWKQLPAMRWLAILLGKLHLLPVTNWAYKHFARWRLARRCQDDVCKS
ncbi:MAG: DUF393 domain-containing protein [Gammaproteobacteria bacterium]|nr:DUF393 domain-containing protein [Gammaproteobacteria bacterium]